MRIGTFANKFNLNTDTVRYYIKKGLIIPKQKNKQYIFNDECVQAMEFVLAYKKMGFTLSEIQELLSVGRLYSFKDNDVIEFYINALNRKKNELFRQRDEIDLSLTNLEDKVKTLENLEGAVVNKLGVPLGFISEMVCPHCNRTLEINNGIIKSTYLFAGELSCVCGFDAVIREGIIYMPMDNTVIRTIGPSNSVRIQTYRLTKRFKEMQYRCYKWMEDQIAVRDSEGYIMTYGEHSGGFVIDYLNKAKDTVASTILICVPTVEHLVNIKNRLEQIGAKENIVFIMSDMNYLPIRKKSVGLFIDDYSSYFSSFVIGKPILSNLKPYMANDARAVGLFIHHKPKGETMKNIEKIYPRADTSYLALSNFKKYIEQLDFRIVADESHGGMLDPGKFLSYCHPNEKVMFYTFEITIKNE